MLQPFQTVLNLKYLPFFTLPKPYQPKISTIFQPCTAVSKTKYSPFLPSMSSRDPVLLLACQYACASNQCMQWSGLLFIFLHTVSQSGKELMNMYIYNSFANENVKHTAYSTLNSTGKLRSD